MHVVELSCWLGLTKFIIRSLGSKKCCMLFICNSFSIAVVSHPEDETSERC